MTLTPGVWTEVSYEPPVVINSGVLIKLGSLSGIVSDDGSANVFEFTSSGELIVPTLLAVSSGTRRIRVRNKGYGQVTISKDTSGNPVGVLGPNGWCDVENDGTNVVCEGIN